MINRNARQNEQEYENKRKEADKIFKLKGMEYCLNQSWSKWILLITTMNEKNFIKK
jgi:hypothetical protein